MSSIEVITLKITFISTNAQWLRDKLSENFEVFLRKPSQLSQFSGPVRFRQNYVSFRGKKSPLKNPDRIHTIFRKLHLLEILSGS